MGSSLRYHPAVAMKPPDGGGIAKRKLLLLERGEDSVIIRSEGGDPVNLQVSSDLVQIYTNARQRVERFAGARQICRDRVTPNMVMIAKRINRRKRHSVDCVRAG